MPSLEELSAQDLLTYTRSTFPETKSLADRDLILFLGERIPATKKIPQFEKAYRNVRREDFKTEGAAIQQEQETLEEGEGMTKLGTRVGAGLLSAAKGLTSAMTTKAAPLLSPIGALVPKEVWQRKTESLRNKETEYREAAEGLGQGSKLEEFGFMLSDTAASSVPSFAAAFIGGFPAAVAMAGFQSFGNTYDEATQKLLGEGKSQDEAERIAGKAATINGIVTAGLTAAFGGTEKFLAKVAQGGISQAAKKAGVKAVVKEIVKSSALEAPEEGLDQLSQGIVEKMMYNPNKPWKQIGSEAALAALAGPLIGAGVGGAAAGTSFSVEAVNDAWTKAREKGVQELEQRQMEIKPPEDPVLDAATGKMMRGEALTEEETAALATIPTAEEAEEEAKAVLEEEIAKPASLSAAFSAKGSTDVLYEKIFQAAKQGKDAVSGVKDPLLTEAKPLILSGAIGSPQQLKEWVEAGKPSLTDSVQPSDPGDKILLAILPEQQQEIEQRRLAAEQGEPVLAKFDSWLGDFPMFRVEHAGQEQLVTQEQAEALGYAIPELPPKPAKPPAPEPVPAPPPSPEAPPAPTDQLAALQKEKEQLLAQLSANPLGSPGVGMRLKEIAGEMRKLRGQEPVAVEGRKRRKTKLQEALKAMPAQPAAAEAPSTGADEELKLLDEAAKTDPNSPRGKAIHKKLAQINLARAMEEQGEPGEPQPMFFGLPIAMFGFLRNSKRVVPDAPRPFVEPDLVTPMPDLGNLPPDVRTKRDTELAAAAANIEKAARNLAEFDLGVGQDPILPGDEPRLAKGRALRSALEGAQQAHRAIQDNYIRLEQAQNKRTFLGRKHGLSRIPKIGRWLEPNSHIRNGEDAAIHNFLMEVELGRHNAALVGLLISGIDNSTIIDEDSGQVLNIEARDPDASLHLSDMYEGQLADPSAYKMNPAQKATFDKAMALENRIKQLERKYGIMVGDEVTDFSGSSDEPYMTRGPVTSVPDKAKERFDVKPARGKVIGAKPFSSKPRMFKSEAQGWARGYRYATSIEQRMVTRVAAVYKAMAAKRLALDPGIGAQTRAQVELEMRHRTAAARAEGMMDEKEFQARLESELKSRTVDQPAFIGKYLDPKVAQRLNKLFPKTNQSLRHKLVLYNNAVRMVRLGYDGSPILLQGWQTLTTRPDIWARAVGNSLRAFADPRTFASLIQNNPEFGAWARRYVAAGGSIGNVNEFVIGAGENQLLTGGIRKLARKGAQAAQGKGAAVEKLAKAGRLGAEGVAQVTERFGSFYNTLINYAQVQTFRAMASEKGVKPEDWPDLVRNVESLTLQGRVEQAGVSDNWALTERLLFLASGYYRAGAGMIAETMYAWTAGLGSNAPSLRITRKKTALMAMGTFAIFAASSLLLGKRWDEIFERLNPDDDEFGNVDYTLPDGQKRTVSFGGLLKSYLKLIAEIADTAAHNPENFKKADKENPLFKWFWGHASPLVAGTINTILQHDYMGKDFEPVDLVTKEFVPLSVEQFMENDTTPIDFGIQFVGLNVWPQSWKKQELAALDEAARKEYGRGYEELPVRQMMRVSQQVGSTLKKPEKEEQSLEEQKRVNARIELAQGRRNQRVMEQLSVEHRKGLKFLGLNVSSFDSIVRVPYTDDSGRERTLPMRFTESQSEELEMFLVKEYDKIIAENRRELGEIAAMPAGEIRKKAADDLWGDLRRQARANALRQWVRHTNRSASAAK